MEWEDVLLSVIITLVLILIVFVSTVGIDAVREAGQVFILNILKLLLKGDI